MSSLRTLIRIDICIDQSWAIGASPDLWFRPDPQDATDAERTSRLAVQRDPHGTVQLPATALVGSLRRHLGPDADAWLGSGAGDQGSPTQPSALRCLAAIVHNPQVDEVTTTAIDSGRRAAAARSLRREEVVRPGTVHWWLEWDHAAGDLLLADLVTSLRTWRPVIGRRRSANHGRAHVDAVFHRTVDLSDDSDLTWWLGERPLINWNSNADLPGSVWKKVPGGVPVEEFPVLVQRLVVSDGLHVGGRPKVGNLLPTRDTLPSSSWRGVFRHRVEHIVRVSGPRTPEENEALAAETSGRLFGSPRSRGRSLEAGHRGQLRFGDSPVTGALRTRTHVAIDRVSGGAMQGHADDPDDAGGALFEVQYYGPGSSLELWIFNDSDEPLSLGDLTLLKAVVRDLHEGIIGVGGMTSRGYGTVRADGGQR